MADKDKLPVGILVSSWEEYFAIDDSPVQKFIKEALEKGNNITIKVGPIVELSNEAKMIDGMIGAGVALVRKKEESFIDLVLAGKAELSDVDNYIDRWHKSTGGGSLEDYLGLSASEYILFVVDEDNLESIIDARKQK